MDASSPRARGVPCQFSPIPTVSVSIPFLRALPHPLNPNSKVPLLQQLPRFPEAQTALPCSHISQDTFL